MSSLPLEMIAEILCRLQAKELLCCRSVSKPWCALIDGPNFVKLHLKHSVDTSSNLYIILRTTSHVHYMSFDENLVLNDCVTLKELNHPLMCYNHGIKVLGSVNGLLCISNVVDDIAVWNPSIRKHRVVPFLPIELKRYFGTEISWPRVILHSITCLSSVFALIFFSIMTMRKNVYSKHDTMISYLLLVGAVLLDCHSITVLLLSDWAVIWFTSNKVKGASRYRINCLSPLLSLCRKRKRWSRSMGQHLLTSAPSNKPVKELREQYFAWELNSHSRVDVSNALKELIFEQVMGKRSGHDPRTSGFNVLELLTERGVDPPRRKTCFDKLGWSVAGVEFTESLLIWHVAK
ncbi:F-BOX PROTEIN CPR1 [Salix koriyanagi]|uniref:F-BOX PROTEIN CPR1 n=1 Tax=Salix koriyanagi TaxID=2511006 RepID=A0A9Q0ZV93_9ROSI|nr:F-BOX PROTEIN CPR1 [Salix koriyanagi]